MSINKESDEEKEDEGMDWGDGTRIPKPRPNLRHIPGDSVICPTPCFPEGDDGDEWKRREKESGRPKRRAVR